MTYRPNSGKTIQASQSDRARARRERAAERQVARAERSAAEQLEVIIDRGHPDCSEADRLRKQIKEAS